jgi:predicted transcriptional regulator
MRDRRSPLEIVRDILDNGVSTRTSIRLSVGLTSRQTDRYVTWLAKNGLLAETTNGSRRRSFKVTRKGEHILGLINELIDSLGLLPNH